MHYIQKIFIIRFITIVSLSALLLVGADPLIGGITALNIVYVDDDSCPNPGTGTELDPYCSIQEAVDFADPGSEIRVAEGIYRGVQTITATNSYTYTQVVFIDKSLTLRGGFESADWSAQPDPIIHKSIIDAERSGRGISVVGSYAESVTIDGFTVTGGDYTGLGSPEGEYTPVCRRTGHDCGGGVFAYAAEIDLLNSYIFDNYGSTPDSNRSSDGGGVYFYETYFGSSIDNTLIISNTVSGPYGEGGGLSIVDSRDVSIANSIFKANSASDNGGGMVIDSPNNRVSIADTGFFHNKAKDYGGALNISIAYPDEALRMERVRIIDNQANIDGTSLYLRQIGEGPVDASLINILFAESNSRTDNSAANVMKVINWGQLDLYMVHVTAANSPVATFLYAETDYHPGDELEIFLTNTLLADFTNGFVGREIPDGELTIQHTYTLFDNVINQEVVNQGSPTFISSGALTGLAKLDNSYHLSYSSAAIGAGTNAGVELDIDGDERAVEPKYPDIGADEYYPRLYTPLILRAGS